MRSSSRRALRLVLAGLAGSFVTLPATADAPPGQYVTFTRESTTIQDSETKLEWERFFTRTLKTSAQAQTQCDASFGGLPGRIPTIKELFTIFDEEPHTAYEFKGYVTRHVHQPAFGDTTGVDRPYWSSTPVTTDPTKVWGFSFADGAMVELDASSATAYIRCVR